MGATTVCEVAPDRWDLPQVGHLRINRFRTDLIESGVSRGTISHGYGRNAPQRLVLTARVAGCHAELQT